MQKSKLFLISRILISLFLLGLLFYLARENFAKIWQLLSSVKISIFILAFLLFLLGIVFLTWRLKVVLAAQTASFRIRDLFPLSLIGYFFTNFMPTTLGGDLVKGFYISQKTKSKMTSYTSIFVDRVMGMFTLVLIASFALLIVRKDIEVRFIFWTVGLLFLFCIIFILLLSNRQLLKKIGKYLGLVRLLGVLKLDSLAKRVYDSINIYRNYKKTILQAFTLSLVAQLISFFAVYLLCHSLSVSISFGKILLVLPIIVVLCMLPVTINGLGLREWAFVLFFRQDLGDAYALSLSLLYLAMFLLASLLGGIVYLFRR